MRKLWILAVFCAFFAINSVTAEDCRVGQSLNNPSSQDVFKVHEYQGSIYEGGWYHLRRFQNGSWEDFGGGLSGGSVVVNDMIEFEDRLIITGQFSGAGGQTVNNICSWNDRTFQDFNGGLNGEVYSLNVWNGKLVAGGYFTRSVNGNTELNRIAIWDNNSWQPLGGGFHGVPQGYSCEVSDIAVHNGELIALGRFSYADGNTRVNSLARWSGRAWKPFGSGLYSKYIPEGQGVGLSAISYKGELIVSGFFDKVDGNAIKWMAGFDGTRWRSLGYGPSGHSTDLVIYKGNLYASGPFAVTINGQEYSMAYWNGFKWKGAVQVDVNFIESMTLSSDAQKLYFCGSFSQANNVFTGNLAQWICQ